MALRTSLLSSIELIDCKTDDVSLETVINNHQTLLNNGISTNTKALELINILGGMDVVLNKYFQNNSTITKSKNDRIGI